MALRWSAGILLTLFALGAAFLAFARQPPIQEPAMEWELVEADLLLNVLSWAPPDSLPVDPVAQALETYRRHAARRPQERRAWSRLSVLLGETGDVEGLRAALRHLDPDTAGWIKALYLDPRGLEALGAEEAASRIRADLPPGWFRQKALLRLYRATGDREAARAVLEAARQRGRRTAWLLGLVGLTGSGLLVTGILLAVLYPWFFRRAAPAPAPSPPPWSGGTAYLVFVGWFNLAVLSSLFVGFLARVLGLPAPGPWLSSLNYLLHAAGGLCLVQVLALRPAGTGFRAALGIHLDALEGRWGKALLWGAGGYAVAVPLVVLAFLLTYWITGSPGASTNPMMKEIARAQGPGELLPLLFLAVFLAPAFEEALFRGFLYPTLRQRLGPGRAMAASAGIFGVIHFDFHVLLPLTALGLLLAFLYERTGSLIPSMLLHGLWNGGSLALVLLLRWAGN